MKLSDLIAEAKKSVVRVSAPGSFGSGVACGPGVMTNAHVVAGAVRVTIVDSSERQHEARVAWRDGARDLALIECEAAVPQLPAADVELVREGDEVIALGHPLGLNFTVTRGIISAVNRLVEGQYYFQTDAAINPGNSGGPLVSLSGEVIGINTFMLRGGNSLNFAIPIDRALAAIDEAIKGGRIETQQSSCPACEQPISEAQPYCSVCGASTGTRPGPVRLAGEVAHTGSGPPAASHCRNCGTPAPAGVPYCTACGTTMRRD